MPSIDFDAVTGLSETTVQEKLRTEGYNELPLSQKRNFLHIVFEVIHEPMFLLLVASGLIYFFLGDTSEGLILMSSSGSPCTRSRRPSGHSKHSATCRAPGHW
jgi:Ca2+-transporting ATPase